MRLGNRTFDLDGYLVNGGIRREIGTSRARDYGCGVAGLGWEEECIPTGQGCPPHSAAVIPLPSVIVKMRSMAGIFTVSLAPDGQ